MRLLAAITVPWVIVPWVVRSQEVVFIKTTSGQYLVEDDLGDVRLSPLGCDEEWWSRGWKVEKSGYIVSVTTKGCLCRSSEASLPTNVVLCSRVCHDRWQLTGEGNLCLVGTTVCLDYYDLDTSPTALILDDRISNRTATAGLVRPALPTFQLSRRSEKALATQCDSSHADGQLQAHSGDGEHRDLLGRDLLGRDLLGRDLLGPPSFLQAAGDTSLFTQAGAEMDVQLKAIQAKIQEEQELVDDLKAGIDSVSSLLEMGPEDIKPFYGIGLLFELYHLGGAAPFLRTTINQELLANSIIESNLTLPGDSTAMAGDSSDDCEGPVASVSAKLLRKIGVSTNGQYGYRVSGTLAIPPSSASGSAVGGSSTGSFTESSDYVFHVRHLTGDLRIYVFDQCVLNTYIGEMSSDQMASGGIYTDPFSVSASGGYMVDIQLVSQGKYSTSYFQLCLMKQPSATDPATTSASTTGIIPVAVDTEQLYPSSSLPVCGLKSHTKSITCSHSFYDVLSADTVAQVLCPAACSEASPLPSYGHKECLGMSGPVCATAERLGFIGTQGGTVKARKKNRYLPVLKREENPADQSSSAQSSSNSGSKEKTSSPLDAPKWLEGSSSEVCVSLSEPDLTGADFVVTNVKPIALKELDNKAAVAGVLTDAETLLSLEYGDGVSAQAVSDVEVICEGADDVSADSAAGINDLVKVNDRVSLRLLRSTSSYPSVSKIYLDRVAWDEERLASRSIRSAVPDSTPSPLNGWSRLTCNDQSVLLQVLTKSAAVDFPSAQLMCSTTFNDLYNAPNGSSGAGGSGAGGSGGSSGSGDVLTTSLVVTCPKNCQEAEPLVSGYVSYTGESQICAAGIHSGFLGKEGGYLQIVPSPSRLPEAFEGGERAGIKAVKVAPLGESSAGTSTSGRAFILDTPRGELCSYPQVMVGALSRGKGSGKWQLPNGTSMSPPSPDTNEVLEMNVGAFQQTSGHTVSSSLVEVSPELVEKARTDFAVLSEEIADAQLRLQELHGTLSAVMADAVGNSLTLLKQLARRTSNPASSTVVVADLVSTTSIQEIASVWDSSQVDHGPSRWTLGPSDSGVLGIQQKSVVTSRNSPQYGANLIFKQGPYKDLFYQTTVRKNGGKAAMLFSYFSPTNYLSLEFGEEGTVELREMADGTVRTLTTLPSCRMKTSFQATVGANGNRIWVDVNGACNATVPATSSRSSDAAGFLGLATDGASEPVVFSEIRFGPEIALQQFMNDQFVNLDPALTSLAQLTSSYQDPKMFSAGESFFIGRNDAAPSSGQLSTGQLLNGQELSGTTVGQVSGVGGLATQSADCMTDGVLTMSLESTDWLRMSFVSESVQEAWATAAGGVGVAASRLLRAGESANPGVGVLLATRPVCNRGCVTVETSVSISSGTQAGMVYDLTDDFNMRAAFISNVAGGNAAGGTVAAVYRVLGGVADVTRDAVPSGARDGHWHNVTVQLCEANYAVWVDGLPLLKERDRRLNYAPRRIGLGIMTGAAQWRYFKLRTTSPTT
ncbi:LCCL domain protein [Gregarina niphandrodes]|uniref:LCCL domain protein n=1 Tax=Gregarina niphandrodes TaxID=110365 RepID=A0A023B5B6_GRENI|nr:LCCL domain protein [Gregarina niphandrodes]EZG59685.1 LCCL domain protein [Gregarina niphandrodes]|eukprot:XP_011130884.1 LCCL domain protein [Gregarina niphandrodes]